MPIKEKSISTRYLKIYALLLLLILHLYLLAIIGFRIPSLKSESGLFWTVTALYIFVFIYLLKTKWLPFFKALKQISYTDEYLFIHEKNQDIQVPLERIREIELKSLDGLYVFHLMDTQYFGNKVFCKTSFWYPFNYKKVDKELDTIRQLVNKRKRTHFSMDPTSLPSNTSL